MTICAERLPSVYSPLACPQLRLFVLQLRNVQPHLSACDLFSLEYPAVHAVSASEHSERGGDRA